MQLLQESLDDPTAEPCGRCSVCRGELPDRLERRGRRARRCAGRSHGCCAARATSLEPRKMWPGGDFGSRGRIPAELMADEGRVLILADAPEWRELVAGALRVGDASAQRRARRLRRVAEALAHDLGRAARGRGRPVGRRAQGGWWRDVAAHLAKWGSSTRLIDSPTPDRPVLRAAELLRAGGRLVA